MFFFCSYGGQKRFFFKDLQVIIWLTKDEPQGSL